jgi:quinol-cytochrome oxidoreductase complex cytochrome b subunit
MTLYDQVKQSLAERTMPRGKRTWLYYFGGFVLFLLTVQVVTGVLLLAYYIPTTEGAHESVKRINEQIPFGREIRSLHIWSSHGLILFGILHLVGLFVMRSYTRPRSSLWLTWVLLLIALLGAGFTGYLLPWDEVAYSAIKIGTDIAERTPLVGDWLASMLRGGENVTQGTLSRFFALHVAFLPIVVILLALSHTGLALLFGRPKVEGAIEEPLWPSHMLKEMSIWIGLLMLLCILAFLLPFGIGEAYDLKAPSEPRSGVHPEWYFLPLYQLLSFMPEWTVVLISVTAIAFLISIPYLDPTETAKRKRWITIAATAVFAAYVVLTVLAYFSIYSEEKRDDATQEASSLSK